MCVFSFLYPPFVFIGGSHGVSCSRASSNRHHQPVRDPMWNLKAVGPMGRSAGLLGRPNPQWAHRPCSLACGSLPGPTCQWQGDWLLLFMFIALVGPFNPCFDTCRVLICWNVMSWIKPHHYAAKLAQNHLHTF